MTPKTGRPASSAAVHSCPPFALLDAGRPMPQRLEFSSEGGVRLRPALGLGIVVVVVALVVGGCGPSVATSPPGVSDTSDRSPNAAPPTNFASPTDILHRYPEMRRQVY